MHMPPARQRLGKQDLKAGIPAGAEVNLPGKGTQKRLFPRQRILTNALP
jgi:hypothetical protein